MHLADNDLDLPGIRDIPSVVARKGIGAMRPRNVSALYDLKEQCENRMAS